jgi:hypothetical protein
MGRHVPRVAHLLGLGVRRRRDGLAAGAAAHLHDRRRDDRWIPRYILGPGLHFDEGDFNKRGADRCASRDTTGPRIAINPRSATCRIAEGVRRIKCRRYWPESRGPNGTSGRSDRLAVGDFQNTIEFCKIELEHW